MPRTGARQENEPCPAVPREAADTHMAATRRREAHRRALHVSCGIGATRGARIVTRCIGLLPPIDDDAVPRAPATHRSNHSLASDGARMFRNRMRSSASGIVVLVCGCVAQSRFGRLPRDGQLGRNVAATRRAPGSSPAASRQRGNEWAVRSGTSSRRAKPRERPRRSSRRGPSRSA